MRRLAFAVALALGLCAPASPQTAPTRSERPVFLAYDVDSTTLTYCNLAEGYASALGKATTAGASSATVTAVSGTTLFDPVAAGDTLIFNTAAGPIARLILAKASGASITVDAVITIPAAGVTLKYQTYGTSCGTGVTNGWFSLPRGLYTVCLRVAQMNVTGNISMSIDTMNPHAYEQGPIPVLTGGGAIASATYPDNGVCYNLGEVTGMFRIGLQIAGAGAADDGGDTGANREKVDVFISTER